MRSPRRMVFFALVAAAAGGAVLWAGRGAGRQDPEWRARLERVLPQALQSQYELAAVAEEVFLLGPAAGRAVAEHLFERMQGEADPRRLWPAADRVIDVLRRLGPGSEPAVRAALSELRRRRFASQFVALAIIAELGPWHVTLANDLAAIRAPTREQLLSWASPEVTHRNADISAWWMRGAAMRLHRRLAVSPLATTDELVRRVQRDRVVEAMFAARVLATRRTQGAAAGPAIAKWLEALHEGSVDDELMDFGLTGDAVFCFEEALAAIAPAHPLAFAVLWRWVHEGDPERLQRAVRGLSLHRERAEEATEILLSLCNPTRDDAFLEILFAALGNLGRGAGAALPILAQYSRADVFGEEVAAAAQAAAAAIRGR